MSVQITNLSALSKNIVVDLNQSKLKFTQSESSSVRLTGTCSGIGTIKVSALGSIEAETLCDNGVWFFYLDLSSTNDGGIQIDFFGDSETTPRSSLTVNKDSQVSVPQYDSFASPEGNFSSESQPIIHLKYLEIESNISIYNDSGCSNRVGSIKATNTEENIPLTFSTLGRYTLFVVAVDSLGNTTGCVNLNTQYYYAKKFDIISTTDPNNNDQTLDGVCADSTGKCSIKAALDEMIGSYPNVPVLFRLEPGLYNYTASKAGTFYYLKILGSGATNTEIRGAGTSQFSLAAGYLMVLEDLTFSQYSGASLDIFTNSGFLEYKISRVHFENNIAGTYGVISGRNGFEITHSLFKNNTAGSAFYARNTTGSIKFTTFLNNSTRAIQLRGSSQVSIQNSLIYGSTTGIFINEGLKTDIYNSIITGNTSEGILSSAGSSNMALNIHNTTMNENGMVGNGNLNIVGPSNPYSFSINAFNSVFAINSSKANCNTLTGNYTITFSNSLLDEATCPNIGTSSIAPPLFSAIVLQGLSLNVMPQVGSPLIDAGNNSLCSAIDYRGSLRPIQKVLPSPTCDIGAIEVQPTD